MKPSEVEMYSRIKALRYMLKDMVKNGQTFDGSDEVQRETSLQARYLMKDLSKVLHN